VKTVLARHIEKVDFSTKASWSGITSNKIEVLNWGTFPYKPKVSFQLAHNRHSLFINFKVEEKYGVRAVCGQDQEPVYQDSCVEFFIQSKDGRYHNFEFNSQGVLLSASGKNRTDRISRGQEELGQVMRISSGVMNNEGVNIWSLIVGIPFAILGLSSKESYPVNFYKCGDLTEEKHFLSWSPIDTEKPNFHCPEYFGQLVLE
jgi:hypothetical protein